MNISVKKRKSIQIMCMFAMTKKKSKPIIYMGEIPASILLHSMEANHSRAGRHSSTLPYTSVTSYNYKLSNI